MIQRNLSFSQLKSWQECRRAWAYRYRDGYRPKKPKLEFMRGSLVHLGMEHCVPLTASMVGYGWERAVAKWEEEWNPPGAELMVEPGWTEGCFEIVQSALAEFHRDWEVLRDQDGPLIERRLYINLDRYYQGIVFVPDVIARRRTGPYRDGIFTVDFKTYGKMKTDIAGDVDLQGAIYQKGARTNGFPAIGSSLLVLETEPKKTIRIRKDGQPYAGDQERFDGWKAVKGEILTPRGEDFVQGIWEQAVLPLVHEMYDAELRATNDVLPPHLNYYGCQFCEFFAPCQARLKGHDEDVILADSYKRRDSRLKGV